MQSPKGKNVTIKDIARETGLSVGTISKHLNGMKVREDNARLIDETVSRLNYVPNQNASIMRTQRTGFVGIIIPHPHVDLLRRVMLLCQHYLTGLGYTPLIFYSYYDLWTENRVIRKLIKMRVEGVIAVPAFAQEAEYDKLEAAGIPLVFASKEMCVPGRNVVYSDYTEALRAVLSAVRDKGHKRISFIVDDINNDMIEERIERYRTISEEVGVPFCEDLTVRKGNGELSINAAYYSVLQKMQMDDPPTVFIFTNSDMMNGAQVSLLSHGYRIPEDISLCGCMSEQGADISMFKDLSVIVQPTELVSQDASDLLVHLMERRAEKSGAGPNMIQRAYYARFLDRGSIKDLTVEDKNPEIIKETK